MSTHSIDTKMMDNYLAYENLPKISSFAGCFDEERFHMLFYVDEEKKALNLVHRDAKSGLSVKPIDLSAALGLSGNTQHVTVSQNAAGYTALAVGHEDGKGGTNVTLFKPALPADFKAQGALEPFKLKPPSTSSLTNVSSIIMTELVSENKYPHVALVLSAPDTQSIQQVVVHLDSHTWDWDANFVLPETPSAILDISWANFGNHPALWVLASIKTDAGANHSLNAYYYSHGGMSVRNVAVPDGLSLNARISTVSNAAQKDDLLLLGNGLHHYRAEDFSMDGAKSSQMSSDPLFNHVGQASVHQTGSKIRLWFQSHVDSDTVSNGTMCYSRLSLGNDTVRGQESTTKPMPLTSKHLQGSYSCLVNAPNDEFHDQHFVFKDSDGEFQVASQSPRGTWHKTLNHFVIPQPKKLLPLKTYTTSVSFHDPVGKTDEHDVKIAATDTTSAIINGKRQLISASQPLEVKIAPNGKLFLLHEPNNLAVPKLTITADALAKPIEIDPVAQVQSNLTSYDDAKALKDKRVMGEDGKMVPVVDPNANVDVDKAARNLKSLGLRAKQIHEQNLAMAQPAGDITAEGFLDLLEEAWTWVEEKGEEAVKWLHQEGEAMFEFAYEIANETRHIAIDTWHDVVRVAGIIFDGLKVAWNVIKALVGALFNWHAIMESQQALSKNMKDAVLYMRSVADVTIDGMSSWFDKQIEHIEEKLDSLDILLRADTGTLLSSIKEAKPDSSSAASGVATSAKGSLVQHALQHGRTSVESENAPVVNPTDATDTIVDRIVKTTEDWFKNGDVKKKLSSVIDDFQALMKQGPTMPVVIKLMKDLFKILLELIRLGIDDAFALVKLVVDSVFSALTDEIEVPILGELLKWVADKFFTIKIEYPSIIDIVAFVFAIVKVEIDSVANLKLDTDLVTLFPPLTDTISAVKGFFGESQAPEVDQRLSMPIQLMESSDNWMRYSYGCAIFHPLAVALKALISPALNATLVANVMLGTISFDLIELPNVERFEIFLNAIDITFSCPAFDIDDRKNMGPQYFGYAVSSLVMVLRGVGKLFLKSVDSGGTFFEVLAMFIAVVKTTLYGISLKSQLEVAQSEKDDDKITDIDRAIGNLVCSLMASLGTLMMLGIGPKWKEAEPVTAAIIIGAGGLLNTLSECADYGVDEARGVAEINAHNEKKATGQYNGMKR